MKIGIYGGTFNPPHLGHMTAAAAVFSLLGLDRLLLIPAAIPPHKPLPKGSPTPQQRLEMTRLAAEQLGLGSQAQVLDTELRRCGRSYTADTLSALKEQDPGSEYWLLMGADQFLTFQTWRQPERIMALAGLAAFGRTEADTEELFAVQRDYLCRTYPQGRIFTLTVPGVIDVSSTELRRRLANGRGGELLAPAVYGYILRNGLYQTNVNLKCLTLSQLRPVALSHLAHRRIPHVLGTEQTAACLAGRYGADVEKARQAALLHDCTKRLDTPQQLALCRQYGLSLTADETGAPKLLHAITGAAVAQGEYGMDEAVCRAIRWHTTGRAEMSLLEKIIYLADYIEPNRSFPGVETLRRTAQEDLDGAVLMGLEMTIDQMRQEGLPLHPATLEARDFLRDLREKE